MLTRTIPGLHLVSGDNSRGSWHKGHGRTQEAHRLVRLVLGSATPPPFPVMVIMVRIAPRQLDTAGLASSTKGVEDAVAKWLQKDDGRAERAEEIMWIRHNETGGVREYGVRLEISTLGATDEMRRLAAAHPALTALVRAAGWRV